MTNILKETDSRNQSLLLYSMLLCENVAYLNEL